MVGEEKYVLSVGALSNGYIYGFNLLNIASKDFNTYNLINISLSNLY